MIKKIILILLLVLVACNKKKSKSDIEVVFTQDTLNVGYTYWWLESGPFIGNCAEELSLVFTGTVKQLEDATDIAGPLYTSQYGIIEISKMLKIKEIGEKTYANQKFFKSDCFNNLGLQIGDSVLVICYDYEGAYSIPGEKSILKIASLNDPLLTSIKNYIDNDENPIKLKKDIGLWATQNLNRALEKVIECKEEVRSKE